MEEVFLSLVALSKSAAAILKLYITFTTGWCKSQTCLVGKTAIITGANAGIGYQTALDFAKRGAKVILACRNSQKGEEARVAIVEETGNENIVVKLIDMASFDSVRAFAKNINETEDRLDILVNNAGIAEMGNKRSKDGKVLIMQVNYFSSFLLTNLLLDLMKKTKGSRIVNVSSVLARIASGFDVNKLDRFPGNYQAYPHSKLCNILFTIELAKKLKGTEVTTYSAHPGTANTDIFNYVQGPLTIIVLLFKKYFFKTVEEAAQTPIYCSVAKGIEKYSGEHFESCAKVARYKTASTLGLPKNLWNVTEEIVQLKYGKALSQTCLVGKTVIVTGANTGIGYEAALDFAKRGAKVILACRDEDRAQEARYKIVKETGNDNVVVKLINMSSFESVRAFAKEMNENEDRLDILVNNAGVGGIGDKRSKDGHVLLMQINYFSSFLLTNLLIGLMKKNRGGRIVNTSEEGAQTTIYCAVTKEIEDYNGEHFEECRKVPAYKTVKVPGLSKKLWRLTEEIVQLKPEEIQF
ncbi:adh short and/or KR domain containing protein [Asbolus verrucosus]|uniref:Adh short and/or KR domain containing protein n=1 Tax=Asbolus verrucosus TaxID=1661398 RepID=A0A482VQY1_ASBVE|nr:adh short and/or KR domain containing protein [Asbolus verrucosus]